MENDMDFVDYGVFPSKLSSIDDASEEDKKHYVELERYVYYIAWHSDSEGSNVLMEAEEVAGELLEELVKGLKHYKNLHGTEKTKVLKTMICHRLGELKHRFYGTHRKAAKLSISIEMDESAENMVDPAAVTPEVYLINTADSDARVTATRSKLSSTAQKVFDAVIYGNEKLETVMRLSAVRANATFKYPTMNLKSWQVAEALLMPVPAVQQAFNDIKVAYAEVCNGNH